MRVRDQSTCGAHRGDHICIPAWFQTKISPSGNTKIMQNNVEQHCASAQNRGLLWDSNHDLLYHSLPHYHSTTCPDLKYDQGLVRLCLDSTGREGQQGGQHTGGNQHKGMRMYDLSV